MSTLYIVSTPIGNLKDISFRACEIFKNENIIFAEDTRVTKKLLGALNISYENKKIFSCNDFNESQRVEQILQFLEQDKSVILTSDAGTPLISDPGYTIVSTISKIGFKVVPIIGACALIAALSCSGLPCDKFQFLGFLPAKKDKKTFYINDLKNFSGTSIFYESVHRLIDTLKILNDIYPNQNFVVAKEITKTYEEFIRGTVNEVYNFFLKNQDKIKGEFILLIEGFKENSDEEILTIKVEKMLKVLLKDLPLKQAIKITCDILNEKKNKVYKQALIIKENLSK